MGLLERGAFTAVKIHDVPSDASMIGGRFVYTLKNVVTPTEQAKARFVAQGYRDRAKYFVRSQFGHNVPTLYTPLILHGRNPWVADLCARHYTSIPPEPGAVCAPIIPAPPSGRPTFI